MDESLRNLQELLMKESLSKKEKSDSIVFLHRGFNDKSPKTPNKNKQKNEVRSEIILKKRGTSSRVDVLQPLSEQNKIQRTSPVNLNQEKLRIEDIYRFSGTDQFSFCSHESIQTSSFR